MQDHELYGILDFVRRSESLKSTLRTSWARNGRQESTAEHSWRLSLFAMLVCARNPELDALKVLKLCIVHDLGEAISGDIPAPEQTGPKYEQERADLLDLLRPLPDDLRDEIVELWDDYESAGSPEAQAVKAMDKLETMLQQTQGINPQSFFYPFNLSYGRKYTDNAELFRRIRRAIDDETTSCAMARGLPLPKG